MFSKLTNNLWGDPVLGRILKSNTVEGLNYEEVLQYCEAEGGVSLIARLESLIRNLSEKNALKLAEAVYRSVYSTGHCSHAGISEKDFFYILCLNVSLRFKHQSMHDVFNELQHLDLKGGLKFLTRGTGEDTTLSKREQQIVADYFFSRAMIQPTCETVEIVRLLLTKWIVLQKRLKINPKEFKEKIQKVIRHVKLSSRIQILCKTLMDTFKGSFKPWIIRLLLKGLVLDINRLEEYASKKEVMKLRETEERLSNHYLYLGELLNGDEYAKSECILTAFTLNPIPPIFQQLEEIAEQRGHSSEKINKCDIRGLYLINGSTVTKSSTYNAMRAPNRVLDIQELDFPKALRKDLTIVINSPRIHVWFDWVLEWEQLRQNCELYMKNPDLMRNTAKRLNLLESAYNQLTGHADEISLKQENKTRHKTKPKAKWERINTSLKIKNKLFKKYKKLSEKKKVVEGHYHYHKLSTIKVNPYVVLRPSEITQYMKSKCSSHLQGENPTITQEKHPGNGKQKKLQREANSQKKEKATTSKEKQDGVAEDKKQGEPNPQNQALIGTPDRTKRFRRMICWLCDDDNKSNKRRKSSE